MNLQLAVRNQERGLQLILALSICWVVIFFFLGPFVWPLSAEKVILEQTNLAPSWAHPWGTDQLGRDVLARILAGGRISLLVGFLASLVALTLGTMIGLVAGYWGGLLDYCLMRFLDAMRSIPTLVLLLFWQSLTEPSFINVILVIGAVSWLQTARVIRSQVLSLKEREHILAAKALACSNWLILWRHILPYCQGQLWFLFVLEFSGAILMETTLSFLGLGLPANCPSWGNMLAGGQNALIYGHWWQVFFPGGIVILTLLIIHWWGEILDGKP